MEIRDEKKERKPDVNLFLRKRYFVCFWAFIGYILLYVLRSNLSIAIVEMTSEKNLITDNGTVVKQAAAYDWDSKQKGIVLSLFAYGYFFSAVGGILSGRFGGASIFGIGIAGTALLTALSPFLLRFHVVLFAVARVLEGVFESFSAASYLVIFISWAPPAERSRLTLLGFVGAYVGILLNYSVCGFVAQELGYDAVFTITGGVACVWYSIWFLFVSNDPKTDRFITETERNYFKNFCSATTEKKKLSYPWKAIMKSKPVWAICNEYFCYSWAYTFIGFGFPLFVKDAFDADVQTVGFISGIPILGGIFGVVTSAFIADYLRGKGVRIATLHRIYIATGQLSYVIFLVIIGFSTNLTGSMVCFALMRTLSGTADVSYLMVFIDMFGEYAAIIRGLAGVFGNVALVLNSTIMGYMVTDHSRSSWNLYFLLLSIFSGFGFIIFYKFGSGELQEWAASATEDKTDADNEIDLHKI